MKKQAIICVDDEKIVLNSLKEQLRNRIDENFEIEIAEDGNDALEIIQDLIANGYEVPLILSDYVMPGMRGDELFHLLDIKYPHMIKILLTGHATLDGVSNLFAQINLFRYINKPWRIDDLLSAVNEGLILYEASTNNSIEQV